MKAAVLAAALIGVSFPAAGQWIEPVFLSNLIINGMTVASDGRLFLPVQPAAPGTVPQVVEVRNSKPFAFPDMRWNG